MIAPTPTDALLAGRQILNPPPSSLSTTVCPTITLPPGGVLHVPGSPVTTLTASAVYHPNCTDFNAPVDPFYASTTVFIYVVATTTVIAWMLLILLLTNQRAPGSERAPKSTGWLQSRVMPGAIAGGTPIGGLGNRPWLQKTAILFLTIGLTVASVDTFRIARIQHDESINDALWMNEFGLTPSSFRSIDKDFPGHAITNARWMRDYVVGSREIRALRVVSQVFIWLAQVQTLIRLFPRRREKLIIKWFGFSLILCDLIFSCLNSFWVQSRSLPGSYQDAIPALTYLFQLSISLLYAAWVLYYVATKRTYAFFRPSELNMSIIALLAMISIAIPVTFFIADISVPPVAGWGDFFRWTGAAAASVVVWEWVERIEAIEREEKKDGILGREVFDEDELPTSENSSPSTSAGGRSDSGSFEKEKRSSKSFGSVAYRYLRGTSLRKRLGIQAAPTKASHKPAANDGSMEKEANDTMGTKIAEEPQRQSRAPSPPSRVDTASVGSTVYAVHYHPIQATPPVPTTAGTARDTQREPPADESAGGAGGTAPRLQKRVSEVPSRPQRAKIAAKVPSSWAFASNAFKRRKRSPPIEIKKAMGQNGDEAYQSRSQTSRFDFKSRIISLGSGKGDHTAEPPAGGSKRDSTAQAPQPTVIPAPPRGQTWSPDILRHSPNNLLTNTATVNPALAYRRVSTGVTQQQQTPQHARPRGDAYGNNYGSSPTSADRSSPFGQADERRRTANLTPDGEGAEARANNTGSSYRTADQTLGDQAEPASTADPSRRASGAVVRTAQPGPTAPGTSNHTDVGSPDPG